MDEHSRVYTLDDNHLRMISYGTRLRDFSTFPSHRSPSYDISKMRKESLNRLNEAEASLVKQGKVAFQQRFDAVTNLAIYKNNGYPKHLAFDLANYHDKSSDSMIKNYIIKKLSTESGYKIDMYIRVIKDNDTYKDSNIIPPVHGFA